VVLYNNRVGAGNRDGVGYIDINCSIVHVAHGMWAWHRAIHINSGCREIKCPNIRDQINLQEDSSLQSAVHLEQSLAPMHT
jgi:hypothetical protein